jgi:long-subunit fatty acid transport protein
MTHKHIIRLCMIGLLAMGTLSGQVYFQYMGLENSPKHSARSLSLGGNALALESHPMAGLHNPASMYSRDDRFTVYANLNIAAFTERRSFPVQDSWGDYIAENDYVSNRFSKLDGDIAIHYAREGFTVAAGWYTLENFAYDYREEIRSDLGSGAYNRDPLAGLHLVHFSGTAQGLNVALAHDIGERFALGYSFTQVYGSNIEEGFGVIPILNDNKLSSTDTTYFPISPQGYRGNIVNLGLNMNVTDRLQAGFHMNMRGLYSMNGSSMITEMDSSLMLPAYRVDKGSLYNVLIDRPNTYSLALRYIPANELKTTLYAQVDLTGWKSFAAAYFDSADSLVSLFQPEYEAGWTIRAGLEHVFFTGMPVRFGFVFEQSPMNNEMDRSVIHLGSGWVSERVTLDVGVALYQNMYRYDDLFPVEGELRAVRDKVKESSVRTHLSLSYAF